MERPWRWGLEYRPKRSPADPPPLHRRTKLRHRSPCDRDGELFARLGAAKHVGDIVTQFLLRDCRHVS
jgi:hypothetical protein